MKITILASGSGGNATLFEARGTRVLVDAGIAPRTLARALAALGADAAPPDAIVVTHAHGDHTGHAAAYAARHRVPVYMTEATARAATHACGGGHARRYSAREPFALGALTLAPTPLPHDAAQVALVVSDGTHCAAIATDLGEVPPALPGALAACDVLLLESNHDAEMLARGPYPARLKQRIASARGHLSNDQAHALLRALPDAAHTVVLMHLSKTNNRPEVALATARDALAGRRVHLLAAAPATALALDTAALRPTQPLAAALPRPIARCASASARQLALPFGGPAR